MRAVKTGLVDGERIAIASGLAAGDRVVVDGADKLREGAKVEVIDRNTPPPGARPPGEGRSKGGDGKRDERRAGDGKAPAGDGAVPGEKPAGRLEKKGLAKTEGTAPAGATAPAAAPPAAPSAAAPSSAAPGDADREERRRRFRDIMENGTEEQKAEARQRFRERQAAGGGAPAKGAQ